MADSLEWDEDDEAGSEAEFCGADGHEGEVEADDDDGDAEEEDEEAEEEDGQVAGQQVNDSLPASTSSALTCSHPRCFAATEDHVKL